MAHPVVSAQCVRELTTLEASTQIHYMPNGPKSPCSLNRYANFSTLGDIAEKVSETSESTDSELYYAPFWTSSPQAGSTSTVEIFISKDLFRSKNTSIPLSWLSNGTKQSHDAGEGVIIACTLAAFWDFGEIDLEQSDSYMAVKTVSNPNTNTREAQPISLDLTDIKNIRGAGFHHQLMGTTSRWIDGRPGYVQWHRLPFTLATTLVLGISRSPNVSLTTIYSHPLWTTYLKGLEWYPTPGQDLFTFTYTLAEYGYGYGTLSTTIYLAMAVILTYCIITLIFIAYTIATGLSSTTWNSGVELAALALQSRKPDHLGRASVGIDSIKTLSESVGIRVNIDDELELVFAHDRDLGIRGLRKVEYNKEY